MNIQNIFSGLNSSRIGVLAVLNAVDIYPFRILVDAMENAIVPDAEPIPFFGRQFETAGRPRISRQGADLLENALECRRFESVEVLLGRPKDIKFMHGVFSGNRRAASPGFQGPAGL